MQLACIILQAKNAYVDTCNAFAVDAEQEGVKQADDAMGLGRVTIAEKQSMKTFSETLGKVAWHKEVKAVFAQLKAAGVAEAKLGARLLQRATAALNLK